MAIIRSCKDCTDRYVGCHSNCEKYLSEKAEYERLRDLIKERRDAQLYDYYTEKRRRNGYGYNRYWYRNNKSSRNY